MVTYSGLNPVAAATWRDRLIRRVDAVAGTPLGRRQAAQRLESRLSTWYGVQLAPESPRFKKKVARGAIADCVVAADEAEQIIVRALAITSGDVQFTVIPKGSTYATENNGQTRDKIRVFISGLSPLVDDASYILNQMRDARGGRMFFLRNGQFINAKDRRPFLTVVTGGSLQVVSIPTSPTASNNTGGQGCAAASPCPTCFQVLPLTGVCDNC